MDIAIILINWNQADDTIACLKSLQQCAMLDKQIWVVDNHSSGDDLQKIQATYPEAHLIANDKNLGFAAANNLAIQAALKAQAPAILLLNNDAHIYENDLIQLLQTLRRPQIGVVGPVLCVQTQPQKILSAGGSDIGRHVAAHRAQAPRPGLLKQVDYVPGTAVLINPRLIKEIGILDEAFFFGGELADFCARARAAGFLCVIDGSTRAFHSVARSSELRHRLHIYYVLRNRFLYVRKFHQSRRRRLFLYWTVQSVKPWLAAFFSGDCQRARAIRLAVWDGWHGRYGGQNRRVTRGEIV